MPDIDQDQDRSAGKDVLVRVRELDKILSQIGVGLRPDKQLRLQHAKKLELDGLSAHQIRLAIPGVDILLHEWKTLEAERSRWVYTALKDLRRRELDHKFTAANKPRTELDFPELFGHYPQDVIHADMGREGGQTGQSKRVSVTSQTTHGRDGTRPPSSSASSPFSLRELTTLGCVGPQGRENNIIPSRYRVDSMKYHPPSERLLRQEFFDEEMESWRKRDSLQVGFAFEMPSKISYRSDLTPVELETKSITSKAGRRELRQFRHYSRRVKDTLATPLRVPRYDPDSYYQEEDRYFDEIDTRNVGSSHIAPSAHSFQPEPRVPASFGRELHLTTRFPNMPISQILSDNIREQICP
ncbi:hypothetical protein GQ53DRAFT_748748 [Thozetella sp. PMI_491]|nr:hypothetical protein GQ53DRAFT_748748 [Thozetella sp. PMI_491]